ncbi:MAG: DMT family transporter [Parvibaculales bacterium]
MKPYVYLFGAIILEVCGTMMLPFTENFTKPLPSVALVVLYTASFYLMTFTLGQIPLGVVYATWSGLGVFTVALLSYFCNPMCRLLRKRYIQWRMYDCALIASSAEANTKWVIQPATTYFKMPRLAAA